LSTFTPPLQSDPQAPQQELQKRIDYRNLPGQDAGPGENDNDEQDKKEQAG
jgi:hypothetical protein